MFNAGIIASRRSQRLVALTDHYAGADPSGQKRLFFYGNGTLHITQDGTYDKLIVPAEWHINSPSPGLNVGWQIRATHQAGQVTDVGNLNSWVNMSAATPPSLPSPSNWGWTNSGTGGRILIEIRDTATQTIQASARFWTTGYAP